MSPKRGQINKRGKTTKTRNPVLLYTAEGNNKTETLYLNNFSGRGRLTIKQAGGNETDPIKMMCQLRKQTKAMQLSRKNGDCAFCIIDSDTDVVKQPQIDRACAMQSQILRVIVSSPCFEVWFLCHYRPSTSYLTSAEAVEELKRLCKGYKKSMNIYQEICNNTEAAIKNAKMLSDYHNALGRREHSIERNPSSDMYLVVQYIQKMNEDC